MKNIPLNQQPTQIHWSDDMMLQSTKIQGAIHNLLRNNGAVTYTTSKDVNEKMPLPQNSINY